MKILFIYPNITRSVNPQLGICMIAAVAKQRGHECALYDLTTIFPGKEVSVFQATLKKFKPDLLAVSCRSNEWKFLQELFQTVKTSNSLKVFGGPHVTVAPEEVMTIADVAVIGEGEETFSALLNAIESKEDITYIPGIWVKQKNEIIRNPMWKLISDLDSLPIPAWNIFDEIHYYSATVKKNFKNCSVVGTFEKSRGCPYSCTYCSNECVRRLYKGKGKWRREKSPKRIIKEIRTFREKYGLDCIYFIDEVNLTNMGRLKRFCGLYRKEINVPFVFMERPENMSDKKVQLISQAGATNVSIGIESGDENIRRNLLHRHHSQETIISAFQTAKKYGLITHAFTMIGLPGENCNSIRQTYDLLKAARPDNVQTTIFYPLRGTKLFDKVVNYGLFDPDTNMPNNYYERSSLKFSDKMQKELLRSQYLLTYYDDKLIHFLVQTRSHIAFLHIRAISIKIFNVLKKNGFNSLLKAINKQIIRSVAKRLSRGRSSVLRSSTTKNSSKSLIVF